MKNVVLKKFKKCRKKVFTKKKDKDIIKRNCNPFEVNYKKIYKRGRGLYMENEILLNEVMEELNFIEKIFFKKKFFEVYKKGMRKGFKWSNINVR